MSGGERSTMMGHCMIYDSWGCHSLYIFLCACNWGNGVIYFSDDDGCDDGVPHRERRTACNMKLDPSYAAKKLEYSGKSMTRQTSGCRRVLPQPRQWWKDLDNRIHASGSSA